jgi:hypothetical protein
MFESAFGRNSQRSCRFGGILRIDLGGCRYSTASISPNSLAFLYLAMPVRRHAGTFAFVTS